ncbi:MAG: hypothetical protein MUF36_04505 [Bacteroidales bacterium]|nr:hypothetical protein [Bacteroidales bacterium]
MIIYLNNDEIDREQWDNCVKLSPRPRPYAYSWYLDIMSPGWEAMIDDDYDSVFPIPCSKKYGIRYIATPNFLQQLGAFSPDKSQQKAINEFVDYMPYFFRLIDLSVGQRIDNDRYRVTLKSNYELDLSKPYDKLRNNFTSHCRRNIDKAAKKKAEIVSDISPEELIGLFRNNRGLDIRGIKQCDYQRLNSLMHFCLLNKKGRILGIRKSKKKLIYGIFLVEIKGRITMLFVVNTPDSREKRLGYHIVNELIMQSAGTRTILDFAGSSVPSIASFMESFGSINVPFYRIYRNRLPWPVSMFK